MFKRLTKAICVSLCCVFICLAIVDTARAAPCDLKFGAPSFIRHDMTVSYCELCGFGYVTLIITNPYEGADMSNMTVVENLQASGLTYDPTAPDPVTYTVNGGPILVGGAPNISGPDNSILTWTAAQINALDRLEYHPWINRFTTIAITFAVTRDTGLTDEGLVSAVRQISAQLTYTAEYETFPPHRAADLHILSGHAGDGYHGIEHPAAA